LFQEGILAKLDILVNYNIEYLFFTFVLKIICYVAFPDKIPLFGCLGAGHVGMGGLFDRTKHHHRKRLP